MNKANNIDASISSNHKHTLFYQKIDTPIGSVLSIADQDHLYACFFESSLNKKPIEKLLKIYSAELKPGSTHIIDKTRLQLDAYFQKQLKNFSIPLKLTGTEFQKKVWQALLNIPYGKTISYLEEANNINQPTAFRAVANANGKNLFSIIIPCHRVVNANGKLGGYTGGLNKKEFLLNLENN